MENPSKWLHPDDKPGDWYDDEPSILASIIDELQRLKRRMKAHPFRVLFLATAMTALVVLKVSTKPTIYKANVTLRISQGTLSDERGSPLPNSALQDYIYAYVLNKKVLEERIIDNVDIYGKYPIFKEVYDDRGLDEAVTEVRDPLSVKAFRNYFLYDRRYDSTPRSVHLSISYQARDPDFAYKMVRTFADIVINNESARRLREARFAADNAERAVTKARELAVEKKEQLNGAQFDLIRGQLIGDAQLIIDAQSRIEQYDEEVRDYRDRLNRLRRGQERIAFRSRLEENSMAVLWELAWEDRPLYVRPPGPIRLTILAVICLCVFVPLCAIGFGTLDSRVHEPDDVTRLGIPVVGHLPSFEGDRVGSLRDRGALAGRGLLGRIRFIKNRRLRDNRVA